MAEGNNLYLLAGVGALMGLHYWAMGREEESEDFGGIALSNPAARRKRSKSACQKMNEAKADYDRAKKWRDHYTKAAGRIKSRSEKKKIEGYQKSMNKAKAEYKKFKAPCAEEKAQIADTSSAHQERSAASSAYSSRKAPYTRSSRSSSDLDGLRKKMQKAYDAYKSAYEKYRKKKSKSRREKYLDKKKAYMKARDAYHAAKKGSHSYSASSQSSSRHPSGSSTGRSTATRSQRSSSRDSGNDCAALKRAMVSAETKYKKHQKKEPSQFWSKKKWDQWNKKDRKLADTWGRKQQTFMHAMCHRK